MYFTKFVSSVDKSIVTNTDLSKYRYFMLIHLDGVYLSIPEIEMSKFEVHLERLNDYLIIINKANKIEPLSEILTSFTNEFSFSDNDSFIGVALLDNIDKKTGGVKIITEMLPNYPRNHSSAKYELGNSIKRLVDISVPMADGKTIRSKLTLDLLFKLVKLIGLGIN